VKARGQRNVAPARSENFEQITATYKAIIQRDGPWWIGWIEEIPGVNSQGVLARNYSIIFALHFKRRWK